MAKALITGASSGMGKDMAFILSEMGYDLVLVARDEKRLNFIKKSLKTKVEVISLDLSKRENCFKLYKKVRNIDILINNAGFGEFGEFGEFYYTSLKKELNMIDLNISCLHILTKLYLRDFVRKNKGYILNVASLAGFGSGPLMATYYATKAYVLKLSTAINEELRVRRSKVRVSVFCPGPVKTEFNKRAGLEFKMKALSSREASEIAIRGMFRKKMVIIPSLREKIVAFLCKVSPLRIVLIACYHIQVSKRDYCQKIWFFVNHNI